MFKYLFCLLICSYTFIGAFAQETKIPNTIAPFKITLVNGKTYTYQQLAKGKPTVLVYFSPTCEHCINFTEAMLKRKKDLADKQIVMVSYMPIADVKKFDDEYHVSSNPNIKVGTEGYTFIVQQYYHVQRFPFVVEYDKNGKLSKVVPYSLQSDTMAAAL